MKRTIRWRRVSPWCWSTMVDGVEVRAWLAADGIGWCAWHAKEPRRLTRTYDGSRPERWHFGSRLEALRAARRDIAQAKAWEAIASSAFVIGKASDLGVRVRRRDAVSPQTWMYHSTRGEP